MPKSSSSKKFIYKRKSPVKKIKKKEKKTKEFDWEEAFGPPECWESTRELPND